MDASNMPYHHSRSRSKIDHRISGRSFALRRFCCSPRHGLEELLAVGHCCVGSLAASTDWNEVVHAWRDHFEVRTSKLDTPEADVRCHCNWRLHKRTGGESPRCEPRVYIYNATTSRLGAASSTLCTRDKAFLSMSCSCEIHFNLVAWRRTRQRVLLR